MTRNLYLGADLTPAIGAAKPADAFVAANGQILREVTANDFPIRAKGLAEEILQKKPDLVGLQEVALWRTGPPSLAPVLTGGPTATTVRYDYLQELLDRAEQGPDALRSRRRPERVRPRGARRRERRSRRRAAGDRQRRDQRPPDDARRDPRPARRRRRQPKTRSRATSTPCWRCRSSAVPVTIKRGWTATDAKVRGSGGSASSTPTSRRSPAAGPSIGRRRPSWSPRAARRRAPAGRPRRRSQLRRRHRRSGDRLAYEALLAAGMVERSTDDPLSCCLNSSLLAVGRRRQRRRLRPPGRPRDDQRSRRGDACRDSAVTGSSRSTASGTPTTPGSSAPCGSPTRRPRHGEFGGRARSACLGPSAFAGGAGDEFGDFLRLLFVEDAARHPARRGRAVDAVFDRVEDAAFGRFDRRFRGFWPPSGGPEGASSSSRFGAVVAVGAGRVERVAGAAVGLRTATGRS